MNQRSLVEARQIWMALLASGAPCESWMWIRWADLQLLDETGAQSEWLFHFGMARTKQTALDVTCTIYGFDWWNTDPDRLERLTIGFVASRHFEGELLYDEMLRTLEPLADLSGFLEHGQIADRWDLEPQALKLSMPCVLERLRPIAAHALAEAEILLQSVWQESA